jgi:hypothetical protein
MGFDYLVDMSRHSHQSKASSLDQLEMPERNGFDCLLDLVEGLAGAMSVLACDSHLVDVKAPERLGPPIALLGRDPAHGMPANARNPHSSYAGHGRRGRD